MREKTIIVRNIDEFKFGFLDPQDENNYIEIDKNFKEAAEMLKISEDMVKAIIWNFENLIILLRKDLDDIYNK